MLLADVKCYHDVFFSYILHMYKFSNYSTQNKQLLRIASGRYETDSLCCGTARLGCAGISCLLLALLNNRDQAGYSTVVFAAASGIQ